MRFNLAATREKACLSPRLLPRYARVKGKGSFEFQVRILRRVAEPSPEISIGLVEPDKDPPGSRNTPLNRLPYRRPASRVLKSSARAIRTQVPVARPVGSRVSIKCQPNCALPKKLRWRRMIIGSNCGSLIDSSNRNFSTSPTQPKRSAGRCERVAEPKRSLSTVPALTL